MENVKILAIETSCDETAVAIVENGRNVIGDAIYSSMDIFKQYGGVVPEIASRKHVEYLNPCLDQALSQAGMVIDDVDAIAVTCGPGLVGALLCGVSYAKALSFAKNKPLIGVNHIKGHICANFITHKNLEPPFMCLIISGGHSHIVLVEDYNTYRLIGKTRDDAVGEVFDKVARILNLQYPGGPNVERIAKMGKCEYDFPIALKGQKDYDFSFSGLKTSVINKVHNLQQTNTPYKDEDIACSFQENVSKTLCKNTIRACIDYGIKDLAIAGGVSCNTEIRDKFTKECKMCGIELYLPEKKYCTDNAAMIGSAAYYQYIKSNFQDYTLNAYPSLKLC